MLSIPHMIVVFIVVLIVFGPQKLPELARGLGKLMAEFRRASTDFKVAFEEEMREMERQNLQNERRKAVEAATSATAGPNQPATLASPAGTEPPSIGAIEDTRATEAPVISTVAESVPRSSGEPAESKAESAAIANSQESAHNHQYPA